MAMRELPCLLGIAKGGSGRSNILFMWNFWMNIRWPEAAIFFERGSECRLEMVF
jgi:hypothetical protein